MNTSAMPMPGALRWRALHPLLESDGTCSLLYDLERGAVLEVPEDLRLHVAAALETGDPDDEMLSWLVGEDLITADGWAGWSPEEGADTAPALSPAAPESRGSSLFGAGPIGQVYRLDDEIHVGIDQKDEAAASAALDLAFRQSFGLSRVHLHLDWGGGFPGRRLLQHLFVEARRRAALLRKEVSWELRLDASEITPDRAVFLADLPFHVRLRCAAFPALAEGEAPDWSLIEPVLLVVAAELAERTTVEWTLAPGARLRDLWLWAQRSGVRHLDVALETPAETEPLLWLRQVRDDMLAMVEDVLRDLTERRLPADFRPLTRMVRRLMRSEPLARFAEGPLGSPVADLPPGGGGLAAGWPEDGEADEESCPCTGCWARYLCQRSALSASAAAPGERTEERCAVWRLEADAALRLYHRLAQADPIQVLEMFGDVSGIPDEPLGRPEEPWSQLLPC
jgi:hypothetical protein